MQLPKTRHIEIDFDPQGILHVTLARVEILNAFNQVMMDEIASLFNALEEEPDVRVVVFRGKGGVFSAGSDLSEIVSSMEKTVAAGEDVDGLLYRVTRGTGDLLELIDRCPKLVVSVLEGSVLGTGLGIAAVSDVVLADQSAVLALPEVTLGFSPSQISPFVARRIGFSSARMLALTAARINSAEAYRLGFIDYIAADGEELEELVTRTLNAALACEPAAVAHTKALMGQLELLDLGPYLDSAAQIGVNDLCSDTGRQGLNAYATRTTPPWRRRMGA
ncbi:enoyl-CoA hydratase/isomerase family protein [Hoeflea olei]|uniref:Enoyl-CoA hydratase n=1 Tax=Hoeflea olei TaxID=1480615 RepID=A0A1C1YYE6_9HYPH|nr:enoyl-CoA hydratase/isomerase family protein [Hoeflea olei]OCW58528.1 hypothetical protein AWJ14_18740 [Hoeflea olei]